MLSIHIEQYATADSPSEVVERLGKGRLRLNRGDISTSEEGDEEWYLAVGCLESESFADITPLTRGRQPQIKNQN
jgi:hypothetical protein